MPSPSDPPAPSDRSGQPGPTGPARPARPSSRPLALAAGSVLDASPDAAVRAAAAAGFDAVGLRISAEHALDRAGRRALRALADDLGVGVHDVEVLRLRDEDSLAALDPLLEATVELGAARLLVVSDHPDPAATEAMLARTVDRAGIAGVAIGCEYMAWTTPSDPSTATRTALATGAFVVVDLLHHVRVGAGPAELAALVASGRLGWVQLCDAPLEAPSDLLHEARHDRLPPGEGALPLRALLGAVPAEVMVSVEVQSDRLAAATTPAERAALLAAAARRVLQAVDQSPSSTG